VFALSFVTLGASDHIAGGTILIGLSQISVINCSGTCQDKTLRKTDGY
jgi:hypothetical protein